MYYMRAVLPRRTTARLFYWRINVLVAAPPRLNQGTIRDGTVGFDLQYHFPRKQDKSVHLASLLWLLFPSFSFSLLFCSTREPDRDLRRLKTILQAAG
jgi:hypothetical protein